MRDGFRALFALLVASPSLLFGCNDLREDGTPTESAIKGGDHGDFQITSPSFTLPTTVAVAGRRLLVVNSQFNRRDSPELPFTVSSVPRP